MKLEKKLLPKSLVELIIEEDISKLEKFKKKAISNLAKKTQIKGFRRGAKIPDNLIVRHYGEEYINGYAIEYLIDSVYQEALKKEKLLPVGQAEVKEVLNQNPIKIKIHIEVFPEIEISDKYKKIKLSKKEVFVSDEEVENALEEIQRKFTKFEETTSKQYKVKEGDKITIDTEGFDEKKQSLPYTQMQDYPLIIGSKILVPWFEEGLIGQSLGKEIELDITFPKDYHNADFAGKKTVFKVTIKKIEKAEKPKFTPEFIKDLRGKELTIAWFKELIKEEIKETKEANMRIEEENKLLEELKKVSKFEIGEKMLGNQIRNVFEEIKQNLGKDGIRTEDYLASLQLSEEDYKEKNVRPIAIKRLEGELILHKLGEMENVSVSDEEMQNEVNTIINRFESEDVKKRLNNIYIPWNRYYEEVRKRLEYKKLIDSFFEEIKK